MSTDRARVTALTILAALVITPGCWLFNKGESKPPENTSTEAPAKKDALAESAAELKAAGYPLEETVEFGEEVGKYAKLKGNREKDPERWATVDEVLAGVLAARTDPEEQYTIYGTWAHAYGSAGDAAAPAQFRAALEIKPSWWLYDILVRNSESFGDVHAEVCAGVRPLLDELDIEDQLRFYERCSEWVDGDHSQLWPDAKKDYAAIPKLKKKIAERDAEDKEFSQQVAALFPGGGVCIANDCQGLGWRSYWEEEVESKCASDDCFGVGWNSTTSEGATATRCVDDDCLTVGWKTKGALGTWVATCNDEDCLLNGWTVKKGSRAYVVTSEDGGTTYQVTTPKKQKFECDPRAQSGKGFRAGIVCGMVD